MEEESVAGPIPRFRHPEWAERFPWLAQGTTARGGAEEAEGHFDLAFFGPSGGGEEVWRRWRSLVEVTGARTVAHGVQVHGTVVRLHDDATPGLHLGWEADGHVARTPGILLAVTVADCVPVSLVAPEERVVCLIHAGWRGIADGILEGALATLRDRLSIAPGELVLHAGPAICGSCYEVGPEVHRELGRSTPDGPAPVDLRRRLVESAFELGIPEAEITVSAHCTRCGPRDFFSHRGGDSGRQVGFLGVRDGAG